MMQRLFFALWPPAVMSQSLAELAAGYREECRGRLVAAENIHITLAFLGGIPSERVADIMDMAGGIRSEPFCLNLDTIGYWSRPRVLWLGARETPEPLRHLVDSLHAGLEQLHLAADRKARFVAHLTLLRHARRAPRDRMVDTLSWPVDGFRLVQSHTLPTGAQYDCLHQWPLAS